VADEREQDERVGLIVKVEDLLKLFVLVIRRCY